MKLALYLKDYFRHIYTGEPKLNRTETTALWILFFIPLLIYGLYSKWRDDW